MTSPQSKQPETYAALLRRAALYPEQLTSAEWRRVFWDDPARNPDLGATLDTMVEIHLQEAPRRG